MTTLWQTEHVPPIAALARAPAEHWRTVLISSGFDPAARSAGVARAEELSADTQALLGECVRVLQFGQLLFVYGAPRELAYWGRELDRLQIHGARLLFKYWIALELDAAPRGDFLRPSHLGLLLFQKVPADRPRALPFGLQATAVRVPHATCAACGRPVKDWGGKTHHRHPRGAALSDVWRDLPQVVVRDNVAPDFVLDRVAALTGARAGQALHVVQHSAGLSACADPPRADLVLCAAPPPAAPLRLRALTRNRVHVADGIAFLERVARWHPEGVFDLAFADPPYNLAKLYDSYRDTLAEQQYLAWCERWLEGLARVLKPGGSLFVLNLPRWAMHHAAFLNARLIFRHWIAWDALSEPRGRLLPAHYALLYYTKPGAPPVFRYAPVASADAPGAAAPAGEADRVQPPDAPKYCLRPACLRCRKARGDDDKCELSDVWADIHRIRHRRDRDAHPCQLPERLLERIIRLTTRPGDLVFDPFCGAGTTAIAARKLGRDFVVVDLDPNYVRLTRAKLAALQPSGDTAAPLVLPRPRRARPPRVGSKRAVELALQALARTLGRVPAEADLDAGLRQQIARLYPYPGAALKRVKVVLSP